MIGQKIKITLNQNYFVSDGHLVKKSRIHGLPIQSAGLLYKNRIDKHGISIYIPEKVYAAFINHYARIARAEKFVKNPIHDQ